MIRYSSHFVFMIVTTPACGPREKNREVLGFWFSFCFVSFTFGFSHLGVGLCTLMTRIEFIMLECDSYRRDQRCVATQN